MGVSVFANYAIDFGNINFYRVVSGFYAGNFYNDVNAPYRGITYSDVLEVDWSYGGASYSSLFGGTNLTIDAAGNLAGGTVTGYLENAWNGSTWVATWGVEGISVSAVTLQQPFFTPSTADDYALIQSLMSGNDQISGSAYNDVLYGYAGGDTIFGGAGNDLLNGGAGSDLLNGGAGNDTLDGGADTDTASYAGAASGVTVSLATTTSQNTVGAGSDTLLGIENLKGSSFGDTLTGNSGNNALTGGAGNDLLNGGAGNDTLDGGADTDTASYAGAASGVTVSLVTTTSQNTVGAGSDTLLGIENLKGSSFGDTLTGNSGNNALTGGAGNDLLNGGAGNDTLDGGADTDTASYAGAASGVTVSLVTTTSQNTVGAGSDTLLGIENLKGSSFGDTLTGNSGNNALTGGAGNDLLNGGAGNDTLDGGADTDTASYAGAASGVTVSLVTTTSQNTVGAGSDTLLGIENLKGSSFGDTLTGNSGNNALTGGAGNDLLNGGAGNDTLDGGADTDTASYAGAASGVTVSLATTTSQNTVGAGSDTLLGIENLKGSSFGDTLTGNSGNNALTGGAGNDTLKGGTGNDLLVGGTGNDQFVFDTALNAATNVDQITDYNVVNDTIQLENAIFTALAGTGALTSAQFTANADGAAKDANDRIVYETDTGKLYYDNNGSMAGGSIQFATLSAGLSLTNQDFFIV